MKHSNKLNIFNFDKDKVESFLSRLESVGRSKGRIEKLEGILNRYGEFVDWSATLEKTTKYIKDRGDNVSKKTLSDDVQGIKQFLKDHDVKWFRKIQSVNPPRKRPPVVRQEDVLNLIDKLMTIPMRSKKYNHRSKTAVVLSAVTGMRPHEIYRLSWDDIDIEGRIIDLPAEKTKTKDQRYVVFNEEAQELLRDLWKMFPEDYKAFHERIIRYPLEKLEDEEKPKIRLKHCRKYFSQAWERNSGPHGTKEMLLGHFGSIDSTHYNNQSAEDLRSVYDDVSIKLFD